MKAVVISGVNELELRDVADPVPGASEVLISLEAGALNHRDVWIKQGQYAGLKFPCIPGSDGAGRVIQVGPGVDHSWIGREVMINPSFDWGDEPQAQGSGFTILGLPRDGTLAEMIAVPVNQVAPKPAHLSWEEAAALPLAGLTAYRALFSRAQLRAGERVLISGIGGGVAVFALQMAQAAGAEAWVTSSSDEKIERARQLGAAGGFNYARTHWAKEALQTSGSFAVIVDGAGGEGFEQLVDLAAPGGRIVFYGATRGNPPVLPMRKLFWRQISLLGTTMGSPRDWAELMPFINRYQLKPVISREFPLPRAVEAFRFMEHSGQFGKIVLNLKG